MFRHLNHRLGHHLLLLGVMAGLSLPNLGVPSLWDIDEGNNAEAAREMQATGDFVVPKFNCQLRVDKPALLYWLQVGAYRAFGVGEFGARLPSAVSAMFAVLAAYELGRRMFGKPAGLLGGIILASTVGFDVAAHFANPDALLNACTVLTLLFFWLGLAHWSRPLFVPMGICMALGVLAKGPVGLVLPLAVCSLFLLWTRRLRCLLDRRLLLGMLTFTLVMAPWFAWVGSDTKGEFLRGFLLGHNVNRFLSPMENHRGPFWYYGAILLAGFLPWSIFLGPTVWYGLKTLWKPGPEPADPVPLAELAPRLLWCWITVYFVFFSLAATKLPNYILPLYAPLALLTGWFLKRWWSGEVQPAAWVLPCGLVLLALVGVVITTMLGLGSRVLGNDVPDLQAWAVFGTVPILGAVGAGWCLWRRWRAAVLGVLAATAVVFLGALGASGSAALEPQKAPRSLARALRAAQTEQEIRIGCYDYFQPSLVFYCGRMVDRLERPAETREFLRNPLPVYLIVSAPAWEQLKGQIKGPYRLLARQRDFYRKCDVLLVTNK